MYVIDFIFSRYLNILRPNTADGEAGDKPGYIGLISGGSRSEPNTLTGAQHKRNIKIGSKTLNPTPGQHLQSAVTECQHKRSKISIDQLAHGALSKKPQWQPYRRGFVPNQGFDSWWPRLRVDETLHLNQNQQPKTAISAHRPPQSHAERLRTERSLYTAATALVGEK